jgi:hypothetical protein
MWPMSWLFGTVNCRLDQQAKEKGVPSLSIWALNTLVHSDKHTVPHFATSCLTFEMWPLHDGNWPRLLFITKQVRHSGGYTNWCIKCPGRTPELIAYRSIRRPAVTDKRAVSKWIPCAACCVSSHVNRPVYGQWRGFSGSTTAYVDETSETVRPITWSLVYSTVGPNLVFESIGFFWAKSLKV